jgi:hypothetical protein
MSYRSQLAGVVQLGRGVVGTILGDNFSVFRLAVTTNGAIFAQSPIIPLYNAKLAKAKKQDIESTTFDLEIFEAKADNRTLQLGDVLVGLGQDDPATYVFAQARDFKPTLFVRTEFLGTISRPGGLLGTLADQPTSGAVSDIGWIGATIASGTTPSDALVLTLAAGSYAFAATGASAVVPIGLAQTRRNKASNTPALPATEYVDDFVGYTPPLPGVTLQQFDVLDLGVEGRFQVISLFESQGNVGLVGNVLILQKLPS